MADNDRTFSTSTPQANRAEQQGLGMGQKELNAQRTANPDQQATDPRRTEPFDAEPGRVAPEERAIDDRDAAGIADGGGDLGAGTPAGVDIHDAAQEDSPEEDWGDPADEGTIHSANHSRRPVKTEADRGQGKLTRARTKDIISRRG